MRDLRQVLNNDNMKWGKNPSRAAVVELNIFVSKNYDKSCSMSKLKTASKIVPSLVLGIFWCIWAQALDIITAFWSCLTVKFHDKSKRLWIINLCRWCLTVLIKYNGSHTGNYQKYTQHWAWCIKNISIQRHILLLKNMHCREYLSISKSLMENLSIIYIKIATSFSPQFSCRASPLSIVNIEFKDIWQDWSSKIWSSKLFHNWPNVTKWNENF